MKIRKKLYISFIVIVFNISYPFTVYSSEEVKLEALPYFNAVKSFKAEFVQTNSANHTVQYGTVLMKKPGLLKWDYHPPTPISIIIRESIISYYDKEFEEYSYSTINNPIIRVLSSDIKHIENIEFININTIDNQKVVTIKYTKADIQADIIFNIDPISIIGFNISNSDSVTYIQFYNIQNNTTIEDKEFKHTYS
ncbi:outer membrane lipoprotein carrier protein LolA [Ehrlichia sp. JZT12]